jgi:hypothetical protein
MGWSLSFSTAMGISMVSPGFAIAGTASEGILLADGVLVCCRRLRETRYSRSFAQTARWSPHD